MHEAASACNAGELLEELELVQRLTRVVNEKLQEERAVALQEKCVADAAKSLQKQAERDREHAKDELRVTRRDATTRFQRHVEDMEELSACLCDAREKCSVATSALCGARAEAASAHQMMIEEAKQCKEAMEGTREALTDLRSARIDLAKSEAQLCVETDAALALRQTLIHSKSEFARVVTLESDAIESAHRARAAEEVHFEESKVAALAAATEASIARSEAALAKARLDEIARAKRCELYEANLLEESYTELSEARVRLQMSVKEVARLSERLVATEVSLNAEATAARVVAQSLASSEALASFAEKSRSKLETRLAAVAADLEEALTQEAATHQCLLIERDKREQEEEVVSEMFVRITRAKVEGANLRMEVASAEQKMSNACAEREAAKIELTIASEEYCMSSTRLQESLSWGLSLEQALANEHEARLLAWSERVVFENRIQFEVAEAQRGTKKANLREERKAAELFKEGEALQDAKREADFARAQLLRMQELAAARSEADEEYHQELAQARADAKRHARSATELRGELADSRSQLAKHRQASRELAQTKEEFDEVRKSLGKANRTREAIEKQYRELQRKFDSYQLTDSSAITSSPPAKAHAPGALPSWFSTSTFACATAPTEVLVTKSGDVQGTDTPRRLLHSFSTLTPFTLGQASSVSGLQSLIVASPPISLARSSPVSSGSQSPSPSLRRPNSPAAAVGGAGVAPLAPLVSRSRCQGHDAPDEGADITRQPPPPPILVSASCSGLGSGCGGALPPRPSAAVDSAVPHMSYAASRAISVLARQRQEHSI